MSIGIRREDKNKWEARVPLTPQDCQTLHKEHELKFVVQPSSIRAFSDDKYRQVGAEVSEEIDLCDTILAVKEIPLEILTVNKTYSKSHCGEKGLYAFS